MWKPIINISGGWSYRRSSVSDAKTDLICFFIHCKRIKFLTEIEFEDGAKEINIEFASVDFEFAPLAKFRGGIDHESHRCIQSKP